MNSLTMSLCGGCLWLLESDQKHRSFVPFSPRDEPKAAHDLSPPRGCVLAHLSGSSLHPPCSFPGHLTSRAKMKDAPGADQGFYSVQPDSASACRSVCSPSETIRYLSGGVEATEEKGRRDGRRDPVREWRRGQYLGCQ